MARSSGRRGGAAGKAGGAKGSAGRVATGGTAKRAKKEKAGGSGGRARSAAGAAPSSGESRAVTPFQQRLYALCKLIPAGRVATYGAMAAALSSAPRAVGQVRLLVPLFILICLG